MDMVTYGTLCLASQTADHDADGVVPAHCQDTRRKTCMRSRLASQIDTEKDRWRCCRPPVQKAALRNLMRTSPSSPSRCQDGNCPTLCLESPLLPPKRSHKKPPSFLDGAVVSPARKTINKDATEERYLCGRHKSSGQQNATAIETIRRLGRGFEIAVKLKA